MKLYPSLPSPPKLSHPTSLSTHVRSIVDSLRSPDSPVEYVLLNRDHNDSPRAVSWLQPQADTPTGVSSSLELCTTHGRFADQTHFTRAGWYREHVLTACAEEARTCMEHQLHALHGGSALSALDGATYLYGGVDAPSTLRDLVHGTMVPTVSLALHGLAAFEPLVGSSATEPHWEPHPWSVVMWDAETGDATYALNYEAGDASRRAVAIALPREGG